MSDTVECPYCGHDNDMSDGCTDLGSDNRFDTECEECEKEFEVEVEFDPIYSAGKIEYAECGICGKSERDIVKKGKRYPYPTNIKATKICNSCYWDEINKGNY